MNANFDDRGPNELDMPTAVRNSLRPFSDFGFVPTWYRQRQAANTTLGIALLKPSAEIAERYGLDFEVTLALSTYASLEARTIQAINQVMSESPLKGRVEPTLFFLASSDGHAVEWCTTYSSEQPESRIPVPFTIAELSSPTAGKTLVYDRLKHYFHALDRFRYTLPLQEDTYFFGRQDIVNKLRDAMFRSENVGIFGLRKTGKTSVILKHKRSIEIDGDRLLVLMDAQSPDVRSKRWFEVLKEVERRVCSHAGIANAPLSADEDAATRFRRLMVEAQKKRFRSIIIAFDEIEWITPGMALQEDQHWASDFFSLWQTFRSVQQTVTGLSLVIAGVNPRAIEVATFDRHQNPLFGIVASLFLSGLTPDESAEMVRKIGKVMGVHFDAEATGALYRQYGGHPLLTRQACSLENDLSRAEADTFPIKVRESTLNKGTSDRSE